MFWGDICCLTIAVVGYIIARTDCRTVRDKRNVSLCLEVCEPLEFCDTIEERCSPCTTQVCHVLRPLPSGCQQYCAAEKHTLARFKTKLNLEKVHDAVKKYHVEEKTLLIILITLLLLLLLLTTTTATVMLVAVLRFRAQAQSKDYLDKTISTEITKNIMYKALRSSNLNKDNPMDRETSPDVRRQIGGLTDAAGRLSEGLQVNVAIPEELSMEPRDSLLADNSHLSSCHCQPSPLDENL